jgi:RNA polymerase sigma-70 factor (ECF subfamily)
MFPEAAQGAASLCQLEGWMFGMRDELRQWEEAAFVLRAQEGDGEAFRTLIESYDRRLLYYIRRVLGEGEEAFDVLQEVWLRAHRNLRKLRSPRAFRVWLYRIAHDQTISALRRSHREMPLNELPIDGVPDGTAPDSKFDAADVVHAALRALSLDHRRVLTLHFLEDMSVEEVAEVLATNSGTVKSRLHYAKAALRRWIEEREHE